MQTTTRPRTDRVPPDPAQPSLQPRDAQNLPQDTTQQPFGRWRYFVVLPEDGIITMLLAAVVAYVTVASIQAAGWVSEGLNILSPIALVAVVVGYLAVQQRLLPNALVHAIAVAGGCALALWLTANAVVPGRSMHVLLVSLGFWIERVLHNQSTGQTDDIFLLFIAALSFLLAYLTMWLVFHSRRPWLAVIANGVVLMINLDFAPPNELVFLLLFLLAALLLLVRFTLADNVRDWRARHLRFSPDLNWDFLQAGAIFAGIVLLIAYLVPAGAANPTLSNAVQNGIFQTVEQRWEQLFGGLNGPGGSSLSFFGSSLHLSSNVSLPTTEILRYTSTDPTQYLVTQTYDTYDGLADWTQSLTQDHQYPANQQYADLTSEHDTVTQAVTLTGIGNGTRALFAAGTPESFSVATNVQQTVTGDYAASWQSQQSLLNGETYDADSYISSATEDQLRQVPYAATGAADFPDAIISLYMNKDQIAADISPEVATTAQQWTAGTTNPYDAALAIEAQLRTFTYSTSDNGTIPPNEDAVVWFLHGKRGFCTFFATTMALMMRSLGMPARIASGVSNGTYDTAKHNYVVRGTNLHVWTQVFFAGYGWINFEPTQGFPTFTRPTAQASPTPATPTGGATGTPHRGTPTPKRQPTDVTGPGGPQSPLVPILVGVGLSLGFLAALFALVVAGFLVWWRSLFRGASPTAARLGRAVRLGIWTGSRPKRDQTPYEYADQLGVAVPDASAPVHELTDLYVRERWGRQPLAPAASAPVYERARMALTRAIVRRWREIPRWLQARFAPLRGFLGRRRDAVVGRMNRLLDAMVEPPG